MRKNNYKKPRFLGSGNGYRAKKRLQDYVKYNGKFTSIRDVLKKEPLYIWNLAYDNSYIRLASDSKKLLETIMQTEYNHIYTKYNYNLKTSKELKAQKRRLAKKYGVSVDKVHIK